MAKKQSSKPDGETVDGEPLTEATPDAAPTITEPLALPAPEGDAPALPTSANAEVCPPKPGVRKISLKEARALHAAKHLV